jgi:hypothetical protein
LALLGFAFVSACEAGQTPNVPMWGGVKLFFKMCGGKIFKTFWAGLSVGKVRSVCVSLQRNCLPSYGHLLVVVSFSTLAGITVVFESFHIKVSEFFPIGADYICMGKFHFVKLDFI